MARRAAHAGEAVRQHATPQGSRHPRPTGLIAAIALAGAAVVAGAVYLGMRDHGSAHREQPADRHPDDPRMVAATPGAAPGSGPASSDPRKPDPKVSDPKAAVLGSAGSNAADPHAAGPGSAEPKTATPRAPEPAGHPSPGPGSGHKDRGSTRRPAVPEAAPGTGSAETEGDEDTRDKLAQATAALDRHDYDLAEHLASAVINSASAEVRQRATARMIHGSVQCAARNDQEAAQIDLRNLAGFRGLRVRLVGVCRSHGILIGP